MFIKEHAGARMKTAALLLLLLLPCFVLAKPSIDWMSAHWPPFRMTEGAQKGQGHIDQLQQMLIAVLPQYEHQVHYNNLVRVEHSIAAPTAQTCIFALLFTESRAKVLRYSIPAVMSLNVMMHVRSNHPLARQWQSQSGVELADVVAEPAINGIVEHSRGYPAVVTRYLDVTGSNLSRQSLHKVNPIDLLTAGRVDYLIELPERVRYFQSISQQKGPITDLPIRGLNALTYSYVACQASAEGDRRLHDINAALVKLRMSPVYQKVMMQWISPHRQQTFLQALPQFVSDETSPTP
jgi:uncharacterized protein (TIGR02285 family)